MTTPFRVCGSCNKEWVSWRDFVSDPEVKLLGLQIVPGTPGEPDANVVVFDHRCGTSISIYARHLRHHLSDPAPAEYADPPTHLDYRACTLRCPKPEDVARCDRPCPKARERHLIQWILAIKKESR